jgi:XTP/dITP diphosphohydrolase
MARHFSGGTLIIASHNRGKVREIGDLLAPFHVVTQSVGDLGLAAPAETGTTFIANAEIKSRSAAAATGQIALADDSGLEVRALGNRPGVYSADWAGPNGDFAPAMARVWREIQATAKGETAEPDLRARFSCALSLCWPDGHCENFEGEVDGSLVWPPRGAHGFGYDPMFLPSRGKKTFGEMEAAAKHAISHRAAAFAKLIDACFKAESGS